MFHGNSNFPQGTMRKITEDGEAIIQGDAPNKCWIIFIYECRCKNKSTKIVTDDPKCKDELVAGWREIGIPVDVYELKTQSSDLDWDRSTLWKASFAAHLENHNKGK